MSISNIFIFTITILFVSIIPGPSMLLALSNGIKYGAKRTTISALGNVFVTLIQASISIAGLGTILLKSASIFLAIKWIGSVYLLFLGLKMLFKKNKENNDYIYDDIEDDKSNLKIFIQSVLVTSSNPKAILFFTAVFPQFINTESALILQSVLLLVMVAIIAFSCFMIYAIGGQKAFTVINSNKIKKTFDKILGITFIGTGIGLATSS